ncbi:MAG: GHKL domain-containing protein [Acidobacteriia bacterium]|nr:GHKL domain-containing protein [Terriglobia bacterium]
MSNGRLTGSSSGRLAVLFLAVVAPPAVALVWLGLQLLQQDRSLWTQRDLERRQAAAQAAIRSLEQSLAGAERLPGGVVRFTVSPLGVRAQPPGRVLWLPVPPLLAAAEARPFVEAEKAEFQGGARESSLLTYQELARAPKPAVRAGALLRLARVHRRAARWDDARAAYRDLAAIDRVAIDGIPADLVARRAACSILEESGNRPELRREAAALEADFLAGRWMLDQPAWELAAAQLERWTGHPLPISAGRKEFSTVADWLWMEWQRNRGEQLPVVGRQTLLWRTSGAESVVIAIAPKILQRWVQGPGDRLSLVTATGDVLAGPPPAPGPATVKLPASETGLPWTLVLSPGDSSRQMQDFAGRRRLLSLGLASILLLLAGGSYFIWRLVQRELAVARLQTEFVSAVSHEFRTPLTSLRHVTELLEEDDDLPLEKRRSFYEALGRNTERLHRLVESLLDFARMEAGRRPYDLRPVDAGELAAQVVADFRREVEPRGFTVDLDVETPAALPLRADAGSLTNALWNLLDNAVKYSMEQRTIHVAVRRHPAGVAISVTDSGLGIPRHERTEIFRRFVRGEKAGRLSIKGTGLGLAMVSHIIQAHGGTIELESEEGTGSTFRLVLPVRV